MKRVLKWVGISVGSLLALALAAGCALYVIGGRKLSAKHIVAAETGLAIPTDSASIARGAFLVRSRPCGACHAPDLGGMVVADAGPFALFAGPNLTRGRGGRTPPLTDIEWERAIRHGIKRDSTSLIMMPSEFFHALTDADVAPLIAYLKQVPPVDREVEPSVVRIVGRLLLGAGKYQTIADMTPRTAHVASMDTTPSVEYGRYLAVVSGCHGCHGPTLSGLPPFAPDGVPASNLTPTGIGHYTEDDFRTTLRTGQRPRGGGAINVEMPWKYFGQMTDGELHALWLYLRSVPPKQFLEP